MSGDDAWGQAGRGWGRRLATAIGLLLVLAALLVLWRQRGTLSDALDAMTRPDPRLVAVLVAAVVANVVLTGLMFSVLIDPHGRVPRLEMQAIIAAATLANYLPLRPGLFGRLAYHRVAHGIPARATAGVVIAALVITSGLAVALAGAALLARGLGWSLWATALAPLPLLVLGLSSRATRRWALAGLLRYADLIAWAVRYDAAFRLVDAPIEASSSLALACVGTVAMLVPLVGNGLGLREWGIGLFAPYLSERTLQLGLAADLVNRGVEVIVIAAIGVPAGLWLTRRRREQPAFSDP